MPVNTLGQHLLQMNRALQATLGHGFHMFSLRICNWLDLVQAGRSE